MQAEHEQLLLQLARYTLETITRAAGDFQIEAVLARFSLPTALQEPRACFVTLEKKGQLRGCTGTLVARMPLAAEVVHSTHNTAFYDPRFPPVSADEVPLLQIELSILTPPQPLPYTSPADLLHKLRPGVDGVTLHWQNRRATFLPQVWERLSDPAQFLSALCHKMGLPPETWQQEPLTVEIYGADKVMEAPG